jgi:endonuclease/exonuclease/phosphatase family metal-dependent hydrolase
MSTQPRLRLLTYNVHRCRGTDRQVSPERIAKIIAATGADVVALQELDVNRIRTGRVDQAQFIAAALDMAFHFHPAWRSPRNVLAMPFFLVCP